MNNIQNITIEIDNIKYKSVFDGACCSICNLNSICTPKSKICKLCNAIQKIDNDKGCYFIKESK